MSTKVITPKAMLSFPSLATAKAGPQGGKEKFGCTLVFAPGTDLQALKAAAIEAAEARYPGKGTKMLQIGQLKSPFRTDAEAKGYDEGSVFINVRSDRKPGCVYSHAGADGKPALIDDKDIAVELYAGCFVRASIAAFCYDASGNKGVSFGLNNVQKIADGERLDGRKAAVDEFDLSMAPADLAGIL